jgi:hypothetical protein
MFHADFPGFTLKIVEHSRYLLQIARSKASGCVSSSSEADTVRDSSRGFIEVSLRNARCRMRRPPERSSSSRTRRKFGLRQSL